jgi:hypothetical protein
MPLTLTRISHRRPYAITHVANEHARAATCLSQVSTSDHKPVLAEYSLQLTDHLFEATAKRRSSLDLANGVSVVSRLPARPKSGRDVLDGLARVAKSARTKAATVVKDVLHRNRDMTKPPQTAEAHPLVRIQFLDLIDLQSGDLDGGSDPCTQHRWHTDRTLNITRAECSEARTRGRAVRMRRT